MDRQALAARHPRLSLIALAILTGGTAQAQTTAETDSRNAALPAVTVQAASEKNGSAEDGYLSKKTTGVGVWGERDLQDTPYSMSIISSDLIENANAKDMDQLFKMNPVTQETGKIASDATDSPWVTIRGFQVTNPIVNGIPYASRVAGTPTMQELERVEVINGATGFLYGGGRVGGAVNYVTKRPTLHNLRNVSFGTYGGSTYFGHVDLGGQLDRNNVFGYRFNAVYQDGETSRKELKRTKAVNLALDFKPTTHFTADLRFSHKDTVAPGPNIFWATNEQIDRSRSGIHRNQSYTPPWLQQDFRSNKVEGHVRWDLNEVFTFRSGLYYERVGKTGGDARMRYLNDTVLATSWFGDYAYQRNDKVGAIAYLDARFDTAGIRHNLTIGYSAATDKIRNTLPTSRSYQIPTDISLDEFRDYPQPADWGTLAVGQPLAKGSKTEVRNIVIGDDIRLNEQWSALVGVNYATTATYNYRTGVNYDKSKATPTLSLIYKPLQNLTTYATYIESLEAGSVVGTAYLNENEILDPYVSKQYEIGTKYSLNDRALISVALFRIEKANSYVIDTTPLPTLSQDGKQTHQGIEVGFTGRVTDNLSLIAGGTLMDLKVNKADNPALEGKKPTSAAGRMAKVYAEYRFPGVPGLSLSGGAYYTGKKYNNALNTDIVPAYTLFDAGLRYTTRVGGHPTTFNFMVQNITDKVYWSNSLALGDPRTFSLTVRTAF
ncbi:MAG: TonB-dependent siderophore receptor [Burkholderiaceae bacterium]